MIIQFIAWNMVYSFTGGDARYCTTARVFICGGDEHSVFVTYMFGFI